MIMSERSVHLATLFPGLANQYFVHIHCTFSCNCKQPFLNQQKEENGC